MIHTYWHRLSAIGITDDLGTGQVKRLQLVNRIAFIAMLLFVPYVLRYLELEQRLAAGLQAFTILGFGGVLGLNFRRAYLAGRYLLIVVSNVNLLVTSSVMGFASGEHLGYLVLVIFVTLMFDLRRESSHAFLALSLTTLCFVGLVWYDFTLVHGTQGLDRTVQYESYLFNFAVTVAISVIVGYYFQLFSQEEVQRIAERGRRQLRSAFDHSKAGIMLVEVERMEIIEVNQRAKALLGLPPETQPGHSLHALRSGYWPTEELIMRIGRAYLTHTPQELHAQLPGGQSTWLMLEGVDFEYQGQQLLHLQWIDMTEKKLYEQDLIKAKEIAQSATIAKAHFLSNMSHEFRTPLNGIIGLAELMRDEYPDEEVLQEYAALLHESGHRLLRTLSLILQLSQLESGQHEVALRWVDVRPALQELAQAMCPDAIEKGFSLALDLPRQPVMVYVDPALLRIAVEHILHNAIKFTTHGEVRLSLAQAEHPEPQVIITIADTGVGMSAEFVAQKLFMKFEQESEGLDRQYEGAGLGLSITKRIIDIMDGCIEVHSQPQQGSRFQLCFPLRDQLTSSSVTSHTSVSHE